MNVFSHSATKAAIQHFVAVIQRQINPLTNYIGARGVILVQNAETADRSEVRLYKPGEVVWSRVFVDGGALKADLGRARAIALPPEETERRWRITTPQWPIMHAVLPGIGTQPVQDQRR